MNLDPAYERQSGTIRFGTVPIYTVPNGTVYITEPITAQLADLKRNGSNGSRVNEWPTRTRFGTGPNGTVPFSLVKKGS